MWRQRTGKRPSNQPGGNSEVLDMRDMRDLSTAESGWGQGRAPARKHKRVQKKACGSSAIAAACLSLYFSYFIRKHRHDGDIMLSFRAPSFFVQRRFLGAYHCGLREPVVFDVFAKLVSQTMWSTDDRIRYENAHDWSITAGHHKHTTALDGTDSRLGFEGWHNKPNKQDRKSVSRLVSPDADLRRR